MTKSAGSVVRVRCGVHDITAAAFLRVADGHVRESGRVHTWPRVWLLDSERQLGKSGDRGPTGIPRWYEQPGANRAPMSSVDEVAAYIVCPKCGRSRWPEGLTWEKLSPILEKWPDDTLTIAEVAETLGRK